MRRWHVWLRTTVFAAILSVVTACSSESSVQPQLSPGIVIKQAGMDALHQELAAKVKSAAVSIMNEPGLVGTLGGARVKLLRAGTHEVWLPLPQLADGQVPLAYALQCTPREALLDGRLKKRESSNDIVSLQLQGERNQEVQIEWSAVILVTKSPVIPNPANADSYRLGSGCAQADANEISKLAAVLWPESGQVSDYASRIQGHIRDMKQVKQPRALDALAILDSGANGICTANANLAVALLRAKGIAARSMAVIPPISQQLEMHRIVEYFHEGQWVSFDPSSLNVDVPLKPWQSIVMAKTTLADENLAMKPRMGSMVGCPYAQELELMSAGITLWGQDFFWTIGKPLARFQPDDEVVALAISSWERYLLEGTLSSEQIQACSATNAAELRKMLKPEFSRNPTR